MVPISSSSFTDSTVPPAAVRTESPSEAWMSMPLWVRQSAMVSSYISSVTLNTVTVVPSSGDMTWGSRSWGSEMGVSSAGGAAGTFSSGCTAGATQALSRSSGTLEAGLDAGSAGAWGRSRV